MRKLILLIILLSTTACLAMADRAKITIRVIDETGEPVQGANTHVGFFDEKKHRGLTDTNGLFSASGNPPYHEISYGVRKEGYYQHWDEYAFSWTYDPKDKCEPWNPTIDVEFKEIKNPISMYVKKLEIEIPVEGKPVGFDLEKGDWVNPYGGG